MQSLDGHLLELYRRNIVSFEDALAKSSNPSEFRTRAHVRGAGRTTGAV